MKSIVLDDWQKEFMEYKGNSILCTGRRVGKTYIHARKACKRMLEKPYTRVIVASLTEDQAKLIIMMARDYLDKYHSKQVSQKQIYTNQSKITLKNGSSILARPVGNTGDAIRGFEGDILILDEVSRFNELILEAATPILLTTGGEIWACSTPFGKQGWFYNSFLNKEGRFKVWHITSEAVINNRPISMGWSEEQRKKAIKFLEEEKREKTELSYGQEYLGLFLEELRQFFSDEIINKTCVLQRPQPPVPKTNNYLGVDIARFGGDECSYEVINAPADNQYIHIENVTKKEQPTTQTEDDILHFNFLYKPEKIGIDAGSGSLGVGIFDRLLIRPETKYKVIAMNNRKISLNRDGSSTQRIFKEDMYENMLMMMERSELKLLDQENVRTSLKSVQWEIKGGKVVIFGNYTHITEGLIRAAWLAKKEKSKNWFISYM